MKNFNDRTPSTLYEVYEKRALYEGIANLPLLDRGPFNLMKESANRWGGLVVRVTCHIITERPMNREVVRVQVVYMHKAKEGRPEPVDEIDVPDLARKLKGGQRIIDWSKYKKRRN